MRFIFLLAAGFLGLLQSTFSQQLLNRLYDKSYLYDAAFSVVATSDNYYLIGGISLELGVTSYGSLLKLNLSGDTIWWRTWDFSPNSENRIESLLESTDGNYLAYGRSQDSTGLMPDLYLMKLDTSGQIIWRRQYAIPGIQAPYGMKATADGGYILSGWTGACTTCFEDGFLLKVDSLGNQQWWQTYGGANSDYAFSVDIAADGGYIMGGQTYSLPAGQLRRAWLVKTDALGNQQWARTFGVRDSYAWKVITTSDGGYLLGGHVEDISGEGDAYVVKTDSLGIEQWHFRHGQNGNFEGLYHPRQLPDGSYVVAGGQWSNPAQAFRATLYKLSASGSLLWQRMHTYYGYGISSYIYDLALLPSGGFALAGMVPYTSLPQKNDMWLLTTDACGYTTNNSPQLQAGFGISSSGSLLYQFNNQTGNGCRYSWDFGDGGTSLEEHPQHQYTAAGNYTVQLIACAGINCDTITQTITVTSVADEIFAAAYLSLAPNPASGQVRVSYRLSEGANELVLVSLLGQHVLNKSLPAHSNYAIIETGPLPPGVYLLQLRSNGKLFQMQKLVVVKE